MLGSPFQFFYVNAVELFFHKFAVVFSFLERATRGPNAQIISNRNCDTSDPLIPRGSVRLLFAEGLVGDFNATVVDEESSRSLKLTNTR